MHGAITAESSGVPGEGSVFRLTIQADVAPDPEQVVPRCRSSSSLANAC